VARLIYRHDRSRVEGLGRVRLGTLAGVVGATLFTGGWIAGGLLQARDYHWQNQEISDLGALTTPHAWVWNLADSISGSLIVVLAIVLFTVISPNRAGRIGALLIGVIGVGGAFDGILREDCPLATSLTCQRHQRYFGLSWHQQAHDVESMIVGVAMLVAPFAMAIAFSQLGAPRALRYYTTASGILLVVLAGVYVELYGETDGGIIQRMLMTICMAWVTVLAVWMQKKLPHTNLNCTHKARDQGNITGEVLGEMPERIYSQSNREEVMKC
jgi:hypothetical protein